MMRLSCARDPETSLCQPFEYSSSHYMRQLNQLFAPVFGFIERLLVRLSGAIGYYAGHENIP